MPSDAGPPHPAEGGERLHPLTLVFGGLTLARRMVFPAIVSGIAAGGGDVARIVLVVTLVLAVPAAIAAVVKYLFFRYRLLDDELVLRSGALARRHRVIPFARIQNVEVRQSLLQRLGGVAELRVETAGVAREAEAVLAVLSAHDARSLRADLLARRRAARTATATATATSPEPPTAGAALGTDDLEAAGDEAVRPIAALGTGDLVLAGATANEAGVIAAAALGLLQLAPNLPFPLLDRIDFGALPIGRSAVALALGVAGLLILFFFVGWLLSIVGSVVRYHGFTLGRTDAELRKRYGLLTVHETNVPLHRVQAVRLEESLLRRPLGLASLMIETAGGTPGERGGAEAFVPLARRARVPGLVRAIFPDMDLESVRFQPVHPRSRGRSTRRYLVVLAVLWIAAGAWAWTAGDWSRALWPAAALPLPFLLARWQYHHRGWALAPGYALARSGVLNRVTWIVPDRKLQTLHLLESPFQRRLGLASVGLDTAAFGRQAVVVDLARAAGEDLVDRLAARMVAAGIGAGAAG
jgi:putative membrane protein